MQANHCNCPTNSFRRIASQLNRNTLPIDKVLQVGMELTVRLKITTECARCIRTPSMTDMLLNITSRLVFFYEAAFLDTECGRAITRKASSDSDVNFQLLSPVPHYGGNEAASQPHRNTAICQPAYRPTKLGTLSFDELEAQLLIEVVLMDACLDLNERLQEWKLIMDEQWEATENRYEEATSHYLDRLAKLIGLLQFDGFSV